jgi:hypothetical protein
VSGPDRCGEARETTDNLGRDAGRLAGCADDLPACIGIPWAPRYRPPRNQSGRRFYHGSCAEWIQRGLHMSINWKSNARWSMVVPTSMGVRMTPPHGQPVASNNVFLLQATSAESNVATISASLGLPVKVLTTFVQDSPVAQFIKDNLRSRGLAFEGPDVPQGGPWGYRHQFNIADSGFGARGPRVHNDRAGEVGRTLQAKDFDLDRLSARRGYN